MAVPLLPSSLASSRAHSPSLLLPPLSSSAAQPLHRTSHSCTLSTPANPPPLKPAHSCILSVLIKPASSLCSSLQGTALRNVLYEPFGPFRVDSQSVTKTERHVTGLTAGTIGRLVAESFQDLGNHQMVAGLHNTRRNIAIGNCSFIDHFSLYAELCKIYDSKVV